MAKKCIVCTRLVKLQVWAIYMLEIERSYFGRDICTQGKVFSCISTFDTKSHRTNLNFPIIIIFLFILRHYHMVHATVKGPISEVVTPSWIILYTGSLNIKLNTYLLLMRYLNPPIVFFFFHIWWSSVGIYCHLLNRIGTILFNACNLNAYSTTGLSTISQSCHLSCKLKLCSKLIYIFWKCISQAEIWTADLKTWRSACILPTQLNCLPSNNI
jgi:hypothetical protein